MENQKSELFDDNRLIKTVNTLIKVASTDEMQLLSKMNNVQYRAKLTELNQDFAITYPALFASLTDDPKKFDMKRLYQMLEMKKQVEKKKVSYEEASNKVGQQYYDEFAKPIIDKIGK